MRFFQSAMLALVTLAGLLFAAPLAAPLVYPSETRGSVRIPQPLAGRVTQPGEPRVLVSAFAEADDKKTDSSPHLPPAGNCKCGCVTTGKCVCKDCDHPKGASPCPPSPNCQCGCTETGKCFCKDCDHPALEKTKVGASADPIVPDGPTPPKPPVPPPPDPTVPMPLAADQLYIIRSAAPIAIRCFPKGLVKITQETGPVKMRGKLICGPSTPGGSDTLDGSAVATRTFKEAYVYTVEASGVGLCDLLIILDASDESKDIRRTLNVGGGPGPLPPGPGPDPPSPDPFQAGDAGFRVLIVYESADLKNYPGTQLNALQSDVWRKYVESKGGNWRCWDKDIDLSKAPPAFAKAMGKPRVSLPYIYVGNGKTGFAGPLPTTLDDLNKLLAKFGG